MRIKKQNLKKGAGEIFLSEGVHQVAIYQDEKGAVSVFSADCPHEHCDVIWNDSAKTWDCPCHGARFDAMGNVIEGPAEENLASLDFKEEDDAIEVEYEGEEVHEA